MKSLRPGNSKRIHLPAPVRPENPGAFIDGGAGRKYIIDEEDARWGNRPSHLISSQYIQEPLMIAELSLGSSAGSLSQENSIAFARSPCYRPGNELRLIISPLPLLPATRGNSTDDVKGEVPFPQLISRQNAQVMIQPPPPMELVTMEDLAHDG